MAVTKSYFAYLPCGYLTRRGLCLWHTCGVHN